MLCILAFTFLLSKCTLRVYWIKMVKKAVTQEFVTSVSRLDKIQRDEGGLKNARADFQFLVQHIRSLEVTTLS